jgi:hypothetical protein
MSRRRRLAIAEERGAMVAEVLVAVAVIGIGLVGLTVVLPVSASSVHEGGRLSTATFLAEQMIERARAMPWSADPAVDCLGVSTGDSAPSPSEATCHGTGTTRFPDEIGEVSGQVGYRRVVRVTECAGATACAGVTGAGMRRVSVSVTYTPLPGARASAARTIQLEWLASRR